MLRCDHTLSDAMSCNVFFLRINFEFTCFGSSNEIDRYKFFFLSLSRVKLTAISHAFKVHISCFCSVQYTPGLYKMIVFVCSDCTVYRIQWTETYRGLRFG